ncbi:calcium-binding protein [Trypanosoma theileri]|uniref:Calcium-binding protein n=1 Tax=Trypanosoma theileri TaxID=67003 RepID=A0A1X0NFQ1_9TRYP|nr:calcium-binding protein [Trypanosoma theileri]ORC83564.1 calcium-binding protein [Trypanosoma theileri]
MTTMFVQLRRVVYLLVLLQCVCVAYAVGGPADPEEKEEVNCTDEKVLKDLKDLADYSSDHYKKLIEQAGHSLGAAEKCLQTWRYDVSVCNESITRIGDVVNTTVHFLYGVRKFKKLEVKSLKKEQSSWVGLLSRVVGVELPDPQPIECGDPRIKEFMDNISNKVGEFNASVEKVAELVKNARSSRYICTPYRQGLEFERGKWKDAGVDWFLDIAKKNSSVVCMDNATREGVATVVTEYNKIVTALDDISNASAGTQVCRLNAGVDWGEDFGRLLGDLRTECQDTPGQKSLPEVKKGVVQEKNLREYLKSDTTSTTSSRSGTTETSGKAEYIKDFDERTEKAKQRKIEEDRRRDAEEEARKREEAKRVADERARKEEEAKRVADERARKEEEAKRVADERARKEEEAKRNAEEKARKEEEAKRAAEMAAREEEAKREKKTRKKDGSSSPALAHSSLILLVLFVLGCTLVC